MSYYIVNIPGKSLVQKEPKVYPTTWDDECEGAEARAWKKARELTRGHHNVSVRIDDELYVLSWYVVVQALTKEEAAAKAKASDSWTRLRETNQTVHAEQDE